MVFNAHDSSTYTKVLIWWYSSQFYDVSYVPHDLRSGICGDTSRCRAGGTDLFIADSNTLSPDLVVVRQTFHRKVTFFPCNQ